MINIKDKVVVVTGCGKIGSKIIEYLDKEGAFVVFMDINKEVGENIRDESDNATFIKGSFADKNDILDVIHFCIAKYKKIDAWINTAFPKPHNWGKENFCDEIMFSNCMNRHLWGHYISTRMVVNTVMKRQEFGSVINFGSIYGSVAPDFSIYDGTEIKMPIIYAMIKASIGIMSKYFASFYGKWNVRFNVISPGGIYEDQPEHFVNRYNWKTPLKRMGKESDLLGLVAFLVSDASGYITGQNIAVDGGILSKL